jgi:PAS domain-containing protein
MWRDVDTATEVDRDDAELGWAARVQRLEAELSGLRRAMRGRALIEQAKGLLAGTLDCTPEAAFDHLSRLSQHENRRLVEVAARIMGTAVPAGLDDPADAPPADARNFDPVRYLSTDGKPDEPAPGDREATRLPAGARIRLQTVLTAIQAAPSLGDLADRLLAEGVGSLGADAVVIYLAEPDGALRMASCAGLPAQVASDWQRIPSAVPTVLGEAIANDRPFWFGGEQEGGYLLIGNGAARAALPLRYAGRTFGGLEPIWAQPREFAEADRDYLVALAGAVARRIWQLSRLVADVLAAPGHWLQSALDAVPAPTMLLSAVRDGAGTVTDFTIDFAAAQSGQPYDQDPAELVGARLLDVRPNLAVAGVFEAYRQVLLTGVPWQRAAQSETILVGGQPRPALISHSAVRLGDGLLASWQVHDAEAELARVAVVEDLGRLGYAEWDLAGGPIRWSAGMYRLFDRSPSRGPLALEELPAQVLPQDLAALEDDLRRVIHERQPGEVQFRIQARGGSRTLRVLLRPSYQDTGGLAVVHAVAQDITELRLRVDAGRRTAQAAAMRRMYRGGGRPAGERSAGDR